MNSIRSVVMLIAVASIVQPAHAAEFDRRCEEDNGGHNIFEQCDKVQEEIVRFLQKGSVAVNEITLPKPTFELPPRPK